MHHSFKEFNTTLCLKKRANFGKLLFRHGLILSMTFCDNMLVACPRVSEALLQQLVSQRLVSRTGVCTMHTRSCISPQSVGNRIVWRTQIWRDKVRCFLLKELDCFTQWCQNASLPSQRYLKANKVSKSELRDKESWTKVSFLKACWCCLSKIAHVCRNYISKVGTFFETQCITYCLTYMGAHRQGQGGSFDPPGRLKHSSVTAS